MITAIIKYYLIVEKPCRDVWCPRSNSLFLLVPDVFLNFLEWSHHHTITPSLEPVRDIRVKVFRLKLSLSSQSNQEKSPVLIIYKRRRSHKNITSTRSNLKKLFGLSIYLPQEKPIVLHIGLLNMNYLMFFHVFGMRYPEFIQDAHHGHNTPSPPPQKYCIS